MRVVDRICGIDDRMQIGMFHEFQQTCEILTGAHGIALHSNILEEDSRKLCTPLVSSSRAANGDGSSRTYGFDGMTPCGRADGFNDGIRLAWQSRTRFKSRIGTGLQHSRTLVFAS